MLLAFDETIDKIHYKKYLNTNSELYFIPVREILLRSRQNLLE